MKQDISNHLCGLTSPVLMLPNPLNTSRPVSVRTVCLLKHDICLQMGTDGVLILTDLGKSSTKKVYERHTSLFAALLAWSAVEDARQFEHIIGNITLATIREHTKKYKTDMEL